MASELIDAITAIPELDGEIYCDNVSYDEIYFDNTLIWKKKNDKNNSDNNWTKGPTNSQWIIYGYQLNNYYTLKANGTTYNYYVDSSRNGDGNVSHSVSFSNTIPFPKGVKTISVSANGNGYDQDGARGGRVYLSIIDKTTGATLKSVQHSNEKNPGCTITYTCTEEEAIHDLVLSVRCDGYGKGRNDCHAYGGLTAWSFTYY